MSHDTFDVELFVQRGPFQFVLRVQATHGDPLWDFTFACFRDVLRFLIAADTLGFIDTLTYQSSFKPWNLAVLVWFPNAQPV